MAALYGIGWTLFAAAAAYCAAVVAAISGGMDYSALGRMVSVGCVVFVILEIIGFQVIESLT